jgi:hypothetical protein
MNTCRVCGKEISEHKELKDCVIEAFGLSKSWHASLSDYHALCIEKGLLQAYGNQSDGQTTFVFTPKITSLGTYVTMDPDVIATLLLTELVPEPHKAERPRHHAPVFAPAVKKVESPLPLDEEEK